MLGILCGIDLARPVEPTCVVGDRFEWQYDRLTRGRK